MTKRFIGGFLVWAALGPAAAAGATQELDLAGVWRATSDGVDVPIIIPGGVHDALLAAGVIDDPYWGANETNAFWVPMREWSIARTFTVDDSFLAHREVVLRLEDCDTFCTVKVNGTVAGTTANRFRRYTFDVKSLLRPGENTIEGVFASPIRTADERRAAAGRAYPMSNVARAVNQALIRKPACHAGWDWGPEIESIGFCGTVKILANDAPRIEYVYTDAAFNDDLTHCTLTVFADLSDGACVTNVIEIDDPPLWWPSGAGEQNFYTFTVDVNGETVTRRVGLRKLELINERTRAADGSDELSFTISVNNRRLFMKGANWIPCDALERRQTPARYRNLLDSAVRANMNMIRVWGGGQYEKDVFYDICDELGLLVWQDMMFACAAYPADAAFLDDVRGELAHQLRRLRGHASLALWCGGNECLGALRWFKETREDDPAFYRAAWVRRATAQGEMVARYDGARAYWPTSPCCGPGDFDNAWRVDAKGDMHQWDVWGGKHLFSRYCKYHPRFCSEFGFQSFPSPTVARTFCDGPGAAFEWHQKNGNGNTRIRDMLAHYFGRAKDFDSELVLSQFQQALALKTGMESWRADMPRCMGTLFWQLNDNWPVSSWSSIEYGGAWKPLQYVAKRIYAPVTVVARLDGTLAGINDTAAPVTGELAVEEWSLDGTAPLRRRVRTVTLAPGTATALGTLVAADGSAPLGDFAAISLTTPQGVARTDWQARLFSEKPPVPAKIAIARDGARLTLSTDRPAFYVWLQADGGQAIFSDNAFTLLPGAPRTVICERGAAADVTVLSLCDTLGGTGD